MFKHLLIPTDGSELGTRAVHAGIDFARSIGAAVTVITVSEPFHLMTVDDPFWYLQTEKLYLEATAKLAHKILKAAEDHAQSKGVKIDSLHVYHDDVHKAILEATRGSRDPVGERAGIVHALLAQRGALFFHEMQRVTGFGARDLEEALWELVASGLATSDGFASVRILTAPHKRAPGW